ncbi:MAG: DUF2283 domain-containing protein [Dehalococcoidia bacterium]|nr:DUF2283 domain-containing protein [Dehalococcoidia bacterium]
MKPKVYYDRETDTLSIWNGIPASEAEDVAEYLIANFDAGGEVVGFTLEWASELLGAVPSAPDSSNKGSNRKSVSRLFGILKYDGPPISLAETEDAAKRW